MSSNESWENYLAYFLGKNLLATACLFSCTPQNASVNGGVLSQAHSQTHIYSLYLALKRAYQEEV